MRRFTFLVILLVLFCVPAYSQSANGKRVLMDDDERSGGSRNAIAAAHDPTPVSNLQFSAAGSFSNTSNPNGVWSYGFTTTLGGGFTLYTISGTTFLSGEVGWFGPIPGAPNAPGYPLVVATPVGTPELLDMGPGPGGEYTVVRWTAASKGVWGVVGRFQGLGRTSSDVHVLSNGTSLFDAALFGSDSAQFALTMRTQPGDTIDFAVGFGPDRNFDFDSTGLEAVIAPHLYDFTAINFPGANLTVANGLNDHGDIVGGYRDSKRVGHAYLLSQGNFTTVDP